MFFVFFILFLLGDFLPFNIGIKQVYANPDILPNDGDAWTENNNATYPWIFHTNYVDTMNWTTSDVHEGSYALNVTHTKASTGMYFRLVLDQNYNVSGYDGIFMWIKVTSPAANNIELIVNPTDTNWDVTNKLDTPLYGVPSNFNATWTRLFIPLMVFDASGTASWNSIRQIYVQVGSLGSADGTEVLVDNLHFTTFHVAGQTPTTDQLKIMPLTYYNMKLGQYTETISGTNYTTMYDWQNLTDNTFSSSSLEFEVVGHNVFALSMAYEATNFDFYLNEAEDLARILLLAQEQNGLGKGGFHNYYSAGWNKLMGSVYNGWIMAGLSHLYGQTSNSTYKTAADLLRNYLTGIMWNEELDVFNPQFDNDTQTVTNATGYSTMRDGACSAGLATYYRYVSQNSTVLDRLDKVLNKILHQVNPYGQTMTYDKVRWEDTAYQMWGMWQAWMATSNTTYRDSFLNVSKILIGTHMKSPSLNGSATRHVGELYLWGISGNYLDGWGLHNSLPLMFLANNIEAQAYFVNASELSLFNHLRLTQTSEGAFQRDSSTYSERQYYGTPSFVVLGLQLYHLNKGTDFYVPASTGRVLNISKTNYTMTIKINKTGTSTTEVYWPYTFAPRKVECSGCSAYSWTHNLTTNITTLTATHSSLVDWTLYVILPDGESCSSNDECANSHCVHGICRSSSTYCGDNYCDTGEDCSSCSSDCGCSSGYYCSNGRCVSYGVTCKGEDQFCLTNATCCPGLYCVDDLCKNITVTPEEEPEEEVLECPPCPSPSEWSECIEGKQNRTNYQCSEETNYICQAYSEEQSCELPEEEIKPTLYRYWYVWLIIVLIVIVMFWRFKLIKK